MQFDPAIRAEFPLLTTTSFSHRGFSTLSDELYKRVMKITTRAIGDNFGVDVGLNVQKINFNSCVVAIRTSSNPGSVNFPLNTVVEGLETVTMEEVLRFIQREGVVFVEIRLPSGVRRFIFHPVPFKFPARLFVNPQTQHVSIEFVIVSAPPNSKFYCCFGELEGFRCANCGASGADMRKCARCKHTPETVRYCCRECQAAHWPKHKGVCSG